MDICFCKLRSWANRAASNFVSATFVLIIIVSVGNKLSGSFSTHYISRKETADRLIRQQSYAYGVDDPRDPRFYNIILEEEALTFQPCHDINKTASTQYSKIKFADRSKDTYTIGETIRAVVTMYDGYRKRKYTGGDQIRATMESKLFLASAPCTVKDNRDGTHTVLCEALWGGNSTINVKLAYRRETVTSIYRTRTKVLASRNLCGMYLNTNSRRETSCTLCHPNSTHLLRHTSYTQLCNLTSFNSGMPFYCGKPTGEYLCCNDLQLIKILNKCKIPITDCEERLFVRGQVTLKQTLAVYVENNHGDRYISVIDKPSVPCSQYNVSLTWYSRKPTGFFHGGNWNVQNCLGAQKQHYWSCLHNRRLYLFGDSTLRQWYKIILKRFKCKLASDGFAKCPKCQQEAECVNKEINFQAGWYFHTQPVYMARSWGTSHPWYSVALRLDNLPRNERAVVVIHVYLHMIFFHHNMFRQKMEIIRKSVENYLLNSKHAIVMIKAPHSFEGTVGKCGLHDYYGDVYRYILFDVFDGLHDRVVLLNNRDATLAKHEKFRHPKGNIVNAMIDQMISYGCSNSK